MVNVLAFAMRIPYLCGAEDPERWARLNKMAYDDELDHDKSVYARKISDMETPGRRLRVFFGFTAFKHDQDKAKHCYNLLKIWEISHYEIEHGESGHEKEKQNLIVEAVSDEKKYPDIAEVLTVEQAVANYGW